MSLRLIQPDVAYIPIALYALAALAAGLDLWRGLRPLRISALVLLILGMVARVATLLAPGLCPLTAGGSGMVVALLLGLHLVAGFRADGSDRARVAVEATLVLLFDLIGFGFMPAGAPVAPPPSERAFGVVHGGLVLLAYAAFFIGALYSAFYLALYRLMKRRRLGFWFSRLPSLERLETRARNSTRVGLSFLTVGLVLGLYSYWVFRGGLPYDDPKFVIAVLAWLLFAGEVVLRRKLRWRGIRVMWMPLAGALVLLLLYGTGGSHPFWSPP